jgi:hypothetical protein
VWRAVDDWGLPALDLIGPPRRFWGDEPSVGPPMLELAVDARRVRELATPASLLDAAPSDDDTWSARSRRSIARLWAHYLICEDPQRRLDARAVETLAHQISLVRHVLDSPHLARVLIADEVGLGKTVEVGLLLKELFEARPELRVLYMAPARLVPNVRQEFDRLGLFFRQWSADESDANLNDPKVIASIHRAVHECHFHRITSTPAWDVLVVDECHHLSDWAPGGGDPKQKYKLVQRLIERQRGDGRVVLLSGTPHQGNISRFENLLDLLRAPGEPDTALAGRVIFRTKDDVRDWNERPLFPRRQVNEPIVIDLGPGYRDWIGRIHDFFSPTTGRNEASDARRRAAAWRRAQALQWAASSPQAGLGYLVRQAIRAGRSLDTGVLCEAVAGLRPYRLGAADEPVERVFDRMAREVERQRRDCDIEDIEEFDADELRSGADLEALLRQGLQILHRSADEKWDVLRSKILASSGGEKLVLFAQPIETVTALAAYLERVVGERPALILGGQDDAQRRLEVERFRRQDGPRFLVSSRAGGEGINLQVARRLVHLDVPWNPMEMEQRVGRVHRFGSRRTILVDTLVVKDTREADAYRVARERLALIAGTMVDPERFESLFARVMCLVPPADLLNVVGKRPLAPLGREDQEQIASLVHAGFAAWDTFHRRFAEQQRSIRRQDPGLASWEDLDLFLRQFAGARPAEGFQAQRFEMIGENIEPVESPFVALTLADGRPYACGDHGGSPVVGPDETVAQPLGLNLPAVAETLRRHAFPRLPSGAAFLRWPAEVPAPSNSPFGVLAFLRQTILTRAATWGEHGCSLWVYLVAGAAEPVLVHGAPKRQLLRGLFASTIRVKAASAGDLTERLRRYEEEIARVLRPPDDRERDLGLRHGVCPLFAAIVDV